MADRHSLDEKRERKRYELNQERYREFCHEAEENNDWLVGSAEIVEAEVTEDGVQFTFEGTPED